MLNTHKCIKPSCDNSYQDSDPDAYYCPSCLAEKNRIAKQIDSKFNTVGQQPNDIFAGSKEMNSSQGGKANFFSAKQLGIL